MYTTYALPPVDTLNSHAGFWVFCFAWILGATVISAIFSDYDDGPVWWIGSYVVGVLIAGLVSFNTGEIKEYPNVKVTGKLISVVAEGYNQEVRSGKTTRRQDVHYLYAIYEIEGQRVPIQVYPGSPLPENAVFYKN